MIQTIKNSSRTLISEADLCKRIKEMSAELKSYYQQKVTTENPLVLIVVLDGASVFYSRLVRNLQLPVLIEFIKVRSYEGMKSTDQVSLLMKWQHSMAGKHVLIVQDILDTGRTAQWLIETINAEKPESIQFCLMLHKPEKIMFEIATKFVGFKISKEFVVGEGLDYDGLFRNWRGITQVILDD